MASKGAKAALMDTSVKRLQANIDKLSKQMGVDPLEIPTYNRDPELLMAYQLEAAANWTDALLKGYEPKESASVKVITDAESADMPDAETEETETVKAPKSARETQTKTSKTKKE